MPNGCFVPGCNTGYKSSLKKIKNAGGKNPSLFSSPKDVETLEKWQRSIPRADKVLGSKDSVCELHFSSNDIERFYETKLSDGSISRIVRGRPMLKKGSVPTIFPNLPSYLTSRPQKRNAPTPRSALHVKEKKESDTHVALPVINFDEAPDFNFDVLIQNLDAVLKPNSWWAVNIVSKYVICVQWNEQFVAERKVIIDASLNVKIFLHDKEICLSTTNIESIESLSCLLNSVDGLIICESMKTKRADRTPSSDSRLCSCHFKDGKKENDPTVFNYTKTEAFDFPSPEKKRKKRPQKSGEPVSTSSPSLQSNAIPICENSDLKKRVEELQAQVKQNRLYFKFNFIRKNDDLVLMYTGLPNAKVFDMLLNYVKQCDFKYYYDWNVTGLTLEDQLFITLQKLRLNYTFDDLAVRYSVSDTTVQNCFHTFVHILHESLFHFILSDKNELLSLQKIQQSSPIVEDFPNCRFLVDCTEIYIETPRSNMEAQRQTLSHYKNRQTLKALLAVTPRGIICFSSDLYPGSSSEKYIFHESGFSESLKPGDLIITDKDFFDQDQLPKGVFLNIPPFLMQAQFTMEKAKYTTQIAHSRINVERAIQCIKSFEILDNIPHKFRSFATKIFQVCITLVNFQTPITDNKVELTKHLRTPD